MLSARALLVALILTATALFVVGVAIERSNGGDHDSDTASVLPLAVPAAGGGHAQEAQGGEAVFVDSDEGESSEEGEGTEGETQTGAAQPEAKKEKHHESGPEAKGGSGEGGGHATEGASADAEEPGHSESKESTSHAEGGSERVFGIDAEATPFVILAVLASLALAFAAWMRPRSTGVLVVVALAMVVFAAFDVRELFHQLDESKTGLAVVAGAVAALHLAAALVAVAMQRRAGDPSGESASESTATITP